MARKKEFKKVIWCKKGGPPPKKSNSLIAQRIKNKGVKTILKKQHGAKKVGLKKKKYFLYSTKKLKITCNKGIKKAIWCEKGRPPKKVLP